MNDITRSAFLKKAAVGGGAAVAAGAAVGLPAGPAAAAPTEQDLAWVRFAVTAEFVSAAYYAPGARLGPLHGRRAARAGAGERRPGAHFNTFRTTLEGLGSRRSTRPTSRSSCPADAFEHAVRALSLGPADRRALLHAYLGALTTVADSAIRRLFAQVAASDAEISSRTSRASPARRSATPSPRCTASRPPPRSSRVPAMTVRARLAVALAGPRAAALGFGTAQAAAQPADGLRRRLADRRVPEDRPGRPLQLRRLEHPGPADPPGRAGRRLRLGGAELHPGALPRRPGREAEVPLLQPPGADRAEGQPGRHQVASTTSPAAASSWWWRTRACRSARTPAPCCATSASASALRNVVSQESDVKDVARQGRARPGRRRLRLRHRRARRGVAAEVDRHPGVRAAEGPLRDRRREGLVEPRGGPRLRARRRPARAAGSSWPTPGFRFPPKPKPKPKAARGERHPAPARAARACAGSGSAPSRWSWAWRRWSRWPSW